MKFVIAGGTGLIGRAIVNELSRTHHEITILTRRPTFPFSPAVKAVQWDASSIGPWVQTVDGSDAVINLTGESLGAGRWTKRQKEKILQSRIRATGAIVKAIGTAAKKPAVLLNASAVGYYGNVEEGDVPESHPPGNDFLSKVCVRWEDAAKEVMQHRVRVVVLRQGFVFARGADAFKRMQLPFKFFAGGPYGSGKQWLPWVHIADVVGAYRFALEHSTLSGPVNVASPNPVQVKGLARELGKAMHRPSLAPAPAFALRLVLGEMSDLLLKGQRVIPKKLLETGYSFKFPSLSEALRDVLGESD